MKKLLYILPMALILCFMVGCQDKAAIAELEEFRAQAALCMSSNDSDTPLSDDIAFSYYS